MKVAEVSSLASFSLFFFWVEDRVTGQCFITRTSAVPLLFSPPSPGLASLSLISPPSWTVSSGVNRNALWIGCGSARQQELCMLLNPRSTLRQEEVSNQQSPRTMLCSGKWNPRHNFWPFVETRLAGDEKVSFYPECSEHQCLKAGISTLDIEIKVLISFDTQQADKGKRKTDKSPHCYVLFLP